MKFQKSSLFEIVGLLIIVISVIGVTDGYVPNLHIYSTVLIIASILYEVYKTKKYIKNHSLKEIRIRNSNDSYGNVFPFIMGSMICISSVLFLFISDGEKLSVYIYFLLGLAFVYQGLNFMPGASLRFEGNVLDFQNGTIKKKIQIEKNDSFSINEDSIIFHIGEAKDEVVFQHLELNESEIQILNNFLKVNIK